MKKDLSSRWQNSMLGNYGTPQLMFTHGAGSYLFDDSGKRYLDLLAGIAVSTLGHSHPAVVKAIQEQSTKLLHTSNLYAHEPGLQLAEKLLSLSDSFARVLFTQDGATANEAALKLARLYGARSETPKTKVVAMRNGFHGRTFGALAVTGNPAKRDPFAPFGIDVEFVDLGNFEQLEMAIDSQTAAVIVEPIQGEGGVILPPTLWLPTIRRLTLDVGALLIVDEVQSGIGRTGEWFMSVADGIQPDVLTLAKGLAAGMPLGAVLVAEPWIDIFAAGDHGTTFGGNPVSCAAALSVISEISSTDLLSQVRSLGDWLQHAIRDLQLPEILEVRGRGLWIAIELNSNSAGAFVQKAQNLGFLVNAVKPNAIRLAPPLNVSQAELQTFVEALPQMFLEVQNV